jgi:endonuclease/exonuclease/phosphatase (EEP) superfamily protein YafD
LLIFGCSAQPSAPVDDASACAASLARGSKTTSQELDASDFGVVNWNIQKGHDVAWGADLARGFADPDLFILQEAFRHNDAWEKIAPEHYHSFAEGFLSSRYMTGVTTVSSVQPLTECDLVSQEPWLGTPKATLVTEYGLTDTDLTLLVVNIHGINFTFGLRDLKEQFRKALSIIARHEGPVLLSGDFNTWRDGRARMVDEDVESLGLARLEFSTDHRKRIFGRPLDHIYARGLDTIHATTQDLSSSDHNPMSVRFALTREQSTAGVIQ